MSIDTWTRAALLIAALGLALAPAGCKEAREAGVDTAADTPAEAVDEAPAAEPPAGDPDLVHHPMPDVLPGRDLVRGEAEILPEIRTPDTGGACPVEIAVDGDAAVITILSMSVNCCTERVRPSVEVRDGVAEVRIWEYMTDMCECFFQRAVRFRLAPFDPAGLEFRVYANDRTLPCFDGTPPAGD